MRIVISNNKSRLEGSTKIILQLRDHPLLAIRRKGAFFSPAFQRRQWDGMVRFVSERGYFDTGKLPQIVKLLEGMNEEVELIDQRDSIPSPSKLPTKIGYIDLRDYQIEALKSIVDSKVGDLEFPRGIIQVATNGGKTAISAAIYKMYKRKTLFLLNSKELMTDILKEMPRLVGEENFGQVASGKPIKWGNFTAVMIQTLKARMDQGVDRKLAEYPVVLVDEGDLATSDTYRTVLNHTYNSFVRIALSGSAMVDKRKKEKNERLRSIFGEPLYAISNRQLIDKGHSSNLKVFIWSGTPKTNTQLTWQEEYDYGIIRSARRNRVIVKRVGFHAKKDRLPMLVMVQRHLHTNILYRKIKKAYPKLKVDWVHHQRPDRDRVVNLFTEGKIDVLVGSFILKRGKNFPKMKALINAAAGDSMANVLQIIGRATRKGDKKYTVIDDFYDEGRYLRRHSKHRITTYKNEKLEVTEKYY